MEFKTIYKDPGTWSVTPNLVDYPKTYEEFDWSQIYQELGVTPERGKMNIGYLAVDRYAQGPEKDKLALRWLGAHGDIADYTYGDLKDQTNRFANLLRSFGLGKGDRLGVLAGRIPALYIAALGALKNTSVFCPLFSAFGPEPIYQRLMRGDAKLLVTTQQQYKKKIVDIWPRLPELKAVLISDIEEDLAENVLSLPRLMAQSSPEFTVPPTDPEDMSCLHFTSGTTGMPKGAIHVHNAVVVHYMTAKYALDLHP